MATQLDLELDGRLVVVAGGGPAAARQVEALIASGADVRVVAPHVCQAIADLAAASTLQWRSHAPRPEDLTGAWLVHACTGDRNADAAISGWAAEQHVWCVNAADPATGSARAPSPARRRDGGRVILVGAGPGDPDLITVRGREMLLGADVVVADRLGSTALLPGLPSGVEVIDVGKDPGNHRVPQAEINRILVERAKAGATVVRLKGGDPFVLGRGAEEVAACRSAGVPVTVVPGVSSALAVPAAAGIPVTHRGRATGVMVITGHDGLSRAEASALADECATMVVLMGVARLRSIVAAALRAGADPETPVAIVENGTLPNQRTTRGRLGSIVDQATAAGVSPPAVIVIGRVAAEDPADPDAADSANGEASTVPSGSERQLG
jgi:uroporphyrin-III C-methyltransferase/precorrin-2 dehydrogenase/sirohydrochlorin ferrochelatase